MTLEKRKESLRKINSKIEINTVTASIMKYFFFFIKLSRHGAPLRLWHKIDGKIVVVELRNANRRTITHENE